MSWLLAFGLLSFGYALGYAVASWRHLTGRAL